MSYNITRKCEGYLRDMAVFFLAGKETADIVEITRTQESNSNNEGGL